MALLLVQYRRNQLYSLKTRALPPYTTISNLKSLGLFKTRSKYKSGRKKKKKTKSAITTPAQHVS